MEEYFCKTGKPEDTKFNCYLIVATHTVMILNCSLEIFLFFTFLQMLCPLYNLLTKESYKI